MTHCPPTSTCTVTTQPPRTCVVHSGSRRSNPPFTNMMRLPLSLSLWTLNMNLCSLSKGTDATRGLDALRDARSRPALVRCWGVEGVGGG